MKKNPTSLFFEYLDTLFFFFLHSFQDQDVFPRYNWLSVRLSVDNVQTECFNHHFALLSFPLLLSKITEFLLYGTSVAAQVYRQWAAEGCSVKSGRGRRSLRPTAALGPVKWWRLSAFMMMWMMEPEKERGEGEKEWVSEWVNVHICCTTKYLHHPEGSPRSSQMMNCRNKVRRSCE